MYSPPFSVGKRKFQLTWKSQSIFNSRPLSLFLFAVIVLFFWPSTVQSKQDFHNSKVSAVKSNNKKLTVIATSDWHGHFVDRYQNFAKEVLEARRQNPEGVVLLDGGDVFQGTLESNTNQGRAMVELYNTLGLDGVAIGNHEFDYGIEQLFSRLEESHHYFLSANTVPPLHDDQVKLTPPAYRLLERNGLRVLLFGLTTTSLPFVKSKNVSGYQFLSLEETTLRDLKSLKNYYKPDITIIVAHAGLVCSTEKLKEDLADCAPDEELYRLEKALPIGMVDLVVGAHTHKIILRQTEKTAVVEAGAFGKNYIRIDWLNALDKSIRPEISLHEIGDKNGAQKIAKKWNKKEQIVLNKINQISERYLQEVLKVKAKKIAYFENDCARSTGLESNLGQMVTEKLRLHYGADLAFYNASGLRDDVKAGSINYGQIYEVLPFDSYVIKVKLSGSELNELMSKIYARRAQNQNPLLYLSGAKVFLKQDKEQNLTYSNLVFDNGLNIIPAQIYTLILNDYLVAGGDVFASLVGMFNAQNQQVLAEDNLRDVVSLELSKQLKIFCPDAIKNPRLILVPSGL